MSVCCECFVLSGRGLCDGLINRLEESYRVCACVCVSSSLISKPQQRGGSGPLGLSSHEKKKLRYIASNIWMTVHAEFERIRQVSCVK
jgi:hypothetical protein